MLRSPGVCSYYGPGLYGTRTANGEIMKPDGMTAAHKMLPFGTKVKVTHLGTNKSVVVRVNDRGPYEGNRDITISERAGKALGMSPSQNVMRVGLAIVP